MTVAAIMHRAVLIIFVTTLVPHKNPRDLQPWLKLSPLRIPAPLANPDQRLDDLTAGFLACGSKFGARLPETCVSVAFGAQTHRLQLRGQPQITPGGFTAFPFILPKEAPSAAKLRNTPAARKSIAARRCAVAGALG